MLRSGTALARAAAGLTPVRTGAYLIVAWVRSSAGEHRLHTAGVTGSNPVAPTTPFESSGYIWVKPAMLGGTGKGRRCLHRAGFRYGDRMTVEPGGGEDGGVVTTVPTEPGVAGTTTVVGAGGGAGS